MLPQDPLIGQKKPPKTSQIERQSKWGHENAKQRSQNKKTQRIGKLLGPILVIFGSILAPKMVPKSLFFYETKQHDFEDHCFMVFGVFLMIFGVEFGTLGYSKMSIWSRRNTNFHKFGLPKSH